MQPVVFVGPSVPASEITARCDCECLPPIKRGDIDALLARETPPAIIGIVDGQFLQEMSISPKEVLKAIDRGVTMLGSSSMGALRAVECSPFGMIGVGEIYRQFQSGELDADDEVAITFDLESHRALCEPMVNIRAALAAAVAANVVTAEVGTLCKRVAKGLYFPDRSYPRLLRELRGLLDVIEVDRLRHFLTHDAPDAKREDALALAVRIDKLAAPVVTDAPVRESAERELMPAVRS